MSLKTRSRLVLVVPLVGLALMILMFAVIQFRVQQLEKTAAHVDLQLVIANRILTDLVDAETGVRGYLLEHDAVFLEPYRIGNRDLTIHMKALEDFSLPDERADVTHLRAAADRARRLLENFLARGKHSRNQTPELTQALAQKQSMDAFRAAIEVIRHRAREERAQSRVDLDRWWRAFDTLFLIVGLTAVFITWFANGRLMGGIVARLEELRDKANRFARGDAPGERMIGNDEIAEVDAAFHSMAHQRRAVEEALAISRDQALEAARIKSQFVATMSHEIRTPMNGVIGMTDLLMRSALSVEQREYGETILQSAKALLNVINDILDFSKLEAGKMELEVLPLDPVSVVESTADLLAVAAAKKRLSLMTYITPEVPRALLGDASRLRQVLINLIGNAIKFTRRGGVTCSVSTVGPISTFARLRFEIRDTGIGLSEEALERLFAPFMQADGSTTRKYGGTGLGLSITKHLVELMGGTIDVKSTEGSGSTFSFELGFEVGRHGADHATSHASSSTDLSDLRIIIVDDDATARQIVGSYAQCWGMTASGVDNAREALAMMHRAVAEGDPYDLAIIDLVMPEIDGCALAAEIKRDPDLSGTRLILISAYDDELRKEASRETATFGAFLTKPIRQSQLFNALSSVMLETVGPSLDAVSAPHRDALIDPAKAQMRVLLADDHPINQRLAKLQLERLGLITDTVDNGREAVQAFVRGGYSIVLMDCQMPEMDGFEATRAIRRHEIQTGARIPIIAMTANAMASDREKCLAAGMDDYIAKPITIDTLSEVLRRWISKATPA